MGITMQPYCTLMQQCDILLAFLGGRGAGGERITKWTSIVIKVKECPRISPCLPYERRLKTRYEKKAAFIFIKNKQRLKLITGGGQSTKCIFKSSGHCKELMTVTLI